MEKLISRLWLRLWIIGCAASISKPTEYRLDLLARQEAKWTRGHAGWDR